MRKTTVKHLLRLVILGLLFMATFTISSSTELATKENSKFRFEYEINEKDTQKLEAGVARLKKGASLDTVKGILGQPDAERILHTKQLIGGGKFVAKQITYVLKRVRVNEDNVNDHVINLYFDQKDKLTEAERLGYSLTGRHEVLGGVQIRERIF